jgi:transcriptional regulator with XRE-family HTH domain
MDTQPLSAILGQVVRKRRIAAKLSQEELAHQARLHRTYISLLERGHRNPSVDTLGSIAAALGLTASQLLAEAEREMGRG